MQRFTSRCAGLLGANRNAHRETIERSEINASVFPGQHTKSTTPWLVNSGMSAPPWPTPPDMSAPLPFGVEERCVHDPSRGPPPMVLHRDLHL